MAGAKYIYRSAKAKFQKLGPIVLNARLKAEEMAAGKIELQFEKGELRGESRDKSPVTTEKDLKLPLKLLQVYGCVFQTPKSTRWGTLGLWIQNWRQVLLLSLADRTR